LDKLNIKIQSENAKGAPIYLQIAEYIKMLISVGVLKKGEKLPNRNELAKSLNANVNTIHHGYRVLEAEGFVIARRGKGSFVSPNIMQEKTELEKKEVYKIVSQALKDSLRFKISPNEFFSITQMVVSEYNRKEIKAALVECHESWLVPIAEKLAKELKMVVDPYLIIDIKKNRRILKDYDLIITAHSHLEELRKLIGTQKEIIVIAIHPSLEAIQEIAKTGARKGAVPFLSRRTVKRVEFALRAMGLNIRLVPLNIQSLEERKQLTNKGEMILVPQSRINDLRHIIKGDIAVVGLDGVIGEDSIEYLRAKVSKLKNNS
jgi:DNA-binding transcriptional regulator YhcF (GntR family)